MTHRPRRIALPQEVDLNQVTISAKLDYVSMRIRKFAIPAILKGRLRWPQSKHGEVATIHDPTPTELALIGSSCHQDPLLEEVEVSVDMRPRPRVDGQARQQLLEAVMVQLFGAGLIPSADDLSTSFRAIYRRYETGYSVRPFNLVLPLPTDQQLHGGREDNLQVKAYLKKKDAGSQLPFSKWSARVEVRMEGRALRRRGCRGVGDLFGFALRKQLMPLFTHARGAVQRRSRPTKLKGRLRDLMEQVHDQRHAELFRRHGVGVFVRDGFGVDRHAVRLVRDRRINKRIGDALSRLESALKKCARS